MLRGLVCLCASAQLVLGQKCWRDTPCSSVTEAAFPGPWDDNIYAPASRNVAPKSILSVKDGNMISSYPGDDMKLQGNGSSLVFDFGLEVGGIVTVKYTVSGEAGGGGAVGLAFTEAKNWIGEWSDDSNGSQKGPDGAIYSHFTTSGDVVYVMPDEKLRGGFRYMTLFLISPAATVAIEDVSLEIGFQPTWPNLRAYQGYFHCDDDLLNKIWYAGAYTLQTNAVPTNAGRHSPFLRTGWANNGTIGSGNTVIVDGAKRDRAVWPGDMGIAVPSAFVSTGDLESIRNALQAVYDHQNADGSFPEAGPPLLQQHSDTYHMWTMVGTYNYVLYTNDTAFLGRNWAGYLRAMAFITAKQTYPSGLLDASGTRDWARWQTGFNMTEAQVILYRALTTGADLARWSGAGDADTLAESWRRRASALRNATLEYCFDAAYGAFKDNATDTALHPQDANSMALLFGVVDASSAAARAISERLTRNWTPLGAEPPELPGNVSPFVSSFEVQAHLAAARADRALELVRRSWGWYLRHRNGTQSTVVEGYRVDGTFGYRRDRGYGGDPSYVSHAHGWSSGPTSALTEFVLGLSVTGVAGSRWRFAPLFGDLGRAEGGFVTGLGRFRASWVRSSGGGGSAGRKGGYEAVVETPAGTEGVVVLPVVAEGRKPRVEVDGKVVCGRWERKGQSVVLPMKGGKHGIVVS
ncbi:uncharacterized protein E0L32_011486 [Thyridium curvatum]|uniref:Alpha-L-rhamnosidase six-hairpin glycosidase domain-containing protein n=1 Tax=Thyridium curvatum TaxID=1093900 RepID=A0A507BFW7_9PEZI|nr:uncharacterized protein E0L32_011486 [Thyridium curvatum]TPX18807.1 hypothetical protein E0L32_011486 [Thyridium curvatum]